MDKGIVYKRREICEICPERTVIIGVPTCKSCGCVIHLKTMVPNAVCPLKKWGPGENFEESN